jgi:hypothetical protein
MEDMKMNKINIVMNELDVKELFLSVAHDYYPDLIRVEHAEDEGIDILIFIQEHDSYIDKIYGRDIKGKYYFARHEWISKELPQIDWYDEFFCKGEVLR